ncbi:hypothetical protein T492DRAFT_856646, partial [Pavlovales sp. CCMP2436]
MHGIGFCLLPLSLKESQSQRLYAFYLGEFRSLRRQLKARQQSTMEESTQEEPTVKGELDSLRADMNEMQEAMRQMSTDLHATLK